MFIYVVTNNVNGKRYVGQTTRSVKTRWRAHLAAAKTKSGHCRALYAAIRKYRSESFTVETVAQAKTMLLLNEMEQQLIREMDTRSPHGYNLKAGGDNGGAHHDETKAKMSASQKGRNKGVPLTAEHRANISASLTGRRPTPETLAKLRGRKMPLEQRERLKNRVFTEEHRVRISEGLKGRYYSPETRAKLSARIISPAQRAGRSERARQRKHTPATKAKMSASRKGHPVTEETREKLRIANLGRKMAPLTAQHKAAIAAGTKQYWATKKSVPMPLFAWLRGVLPRQERVDG